MRQQLAATAKLFSAARPRRAPDGGTHNRKVNPRLVHLSQNLMFDSLKRMSLIANVKLQLLPDVVTEQSCCVIANTGRGIFAKNSADCGCVISVDPEGKLAVLRSLIRPACRQRGQVSVESPNISRAGVPCSPCHQRRHISSRVCSTKNDQFFSSAVVAATLRPTKTSFPAEAPAGKHNIAAQPADRRNILKLLIFHE